MRCLVVFSVVAAVKPTPAPAGIADEYPSLHIPMPKLKTDYKDETPEVETMKEHVKSLDRFSVILTESEKPIPEQEPQNPA